MLLAYIGKRLPIVDSASNAMHLAVTVVSFAGFVLFSIYRYGAGNTSLKEGFKNTKCPAVQKNE